MNKADLIKVRQDHVPRGVSQLLPAMIAEAKGVVVRDVEGRNFWTSPAESAYSTWAIVPTRSSKPYATRRESTCTPASWCKCMSLILP